MRRSLHGLAMRKPVKGEEAGDDWRVFANPERGVRVSTLRLFFDLVFVFTITWLTAVLVDGNGLAALVQVVVMLLVIWWMYDSCAWLTNAISIDRLRIRLLLVGGMGGFLVIALAISRQRSRQGLAFALGYLVVVLPRACTCTGRR